MAGCLCLIPLLESPRALPSIADAQISGGMAALLHGKRHPSGLFFMRPSSPFELKGGFPTHFAIEGGFEPCI